MYEASRDGLFRMRRDAGNNPDFEETRRVFASKMTKIHLQKHQEDMAKSSQALKMNGGHNSTFYTKDRPPISSSKLPAEVAAKPPILSGPVAGGTAGVHPEPPDIRAYGNSYDSTERVQPQSYHSNTSSPGNAFHARQSARQPPAWAPSRESQLPPAPAVPGGNLPCRPSQAASLPGDWSSSAGPVRGWPAEPPGSGKPDLIPALPLSAFTGGADVHVCKPNTQSPAHYALPSTTSRPSPSHNGPVAATSPPPASSETSPQPVQVTPAAMNSASVSKSISRGAEQSPVHSFGQAVSAEAEVPSSSRPAEQGPSAAEMKLEALTKQLEKEMATQPKADYFGKTFN